MRRCPPPGDLFRPEILALIAHPTGRYAAGRPGSSAPDPASGALGEPQVAVRAGGNNERGAAGQPAHRRAAGVSPLSITTASAKILVSCPSLQASRTGTFTHSR
jgi:hypothetical protein